LKDERFVSFLRQARTRQDVIDVLEEADQNSPWSCVPPVASPFRRAPPWRFTRKRFPSSEPWTPCSAAPRRV